MNTGNKIQILDEAAFYFLLIQGQLFKRSYAGLNAGFAISYIGYLSKSI